MQSFAVLALVVASSTSALAAKHQLYTGFFAGSTVVALEFDDVTSSLAIINNISTTYTSGQKWIALDSRHQNLYVATVGAFQSYSINNCTLDLTYETNVTTSTECNNCNFIASQSVSPYTVIGTPYGTGCSSLAISVDSSGSFVEGFNNVTYDANGGIHGTDFTASGDYIYSADDMGNGLWAHLYDSMTGTITELQHLHAPTGADPRHLVVHPGGKWVYVVYEAASQVAAYARDEMTGLLTAQNQTFPLLPTGFTNTSSYWAGEVKLSVASSNSSTTPKYLFASTRSRTVGIPGYISAFSLNAITGAIETQLFLRETTNSGGSSNAVSPAGFSEEFFAIVDASSNFVEVWKMLDEGSGAEVVSHLDLSGGNLPANVVWFS